jgi:hypothetical protein
MTQQTFTAGELRDVLSNVPSERPVYICMVGVFHDDLFAIEQIRDCVMNRVELVIGKAQPTDSATNADSTGDNGTT